MKHKCDGCRYKGEHQEMMFRSFGVCMRETNLADAERSYNADKCPYECAEIGRYNEDSMRAFCECVDKAAESMKEMSDAVMSYQQIIEKMRGNYEK